jgi:hypothetical protein
MFTAEELEECDIFPKKISKMGIIKFTIYACIMSFGLILIYCFYSGRDLTSLLSLEGMKYNTDDYFTNRIWNIDKRFNYNLTDKYTMNIDYLQNNKEIFIKEYVTQSLPLIIKNVSLHMPVLSKFKTNNTESVEQITKLSGNHLFPVEVRRDPNKNYFLERTEVIALNYSEYLKNANNISRKSNYFLNEVRVDGLNTLLAEEIKNLKFLEFLSSRMDITTYSEGFDEFILSGHMEYNEVLLCELIGDIDLLLIPALFRNSVYPFKKNYGPPNYSAADFFVGNYGRFPNLRDTNRLYITLSQGDCIYIPSFWWSSIKTIEEAHYSYIKLNFRPHSRWVYDIIKALESENF